MNERIFTYNRSRSIAYVSKRGKTLSYLTAYDQAQRFIKTRDEATGECITRKANKTEIKKYGINPSK